MKLEKRAEGFLREFFALCERHGGVVLTGGAGGPRVYFTSQERIGKYLEWWEEKGAVAEMNDFEDFL